MKIGLLFGSFNPIHTGHLIIANTVINDSEISKIWFVISPQNPLKKQTELLNANTRLTLASLAINDNKRFSISDVEFKMPLPSYTINTLNFFEKSYPENEFYLILGGDSFLSLPEWKGSNELLLKNIIIYQRPGYTLTIEHLSPNITILNSPLLEISSTQIRALIKKNKSIRYLLPDTVMNEIEKNGFYK